MNEFSLSDNCPDSIPVRCDRIFDSCSDKDCFTRLTVTPEIGTLPENATIVRSRSATVTNACVSVEPVPFNRGFYSIDVTFTFSAEILAYERSCTQPVILTGTATASKNCILYGSESTVRTFSSTDEQPVQPGNENLSSDVLPKATISVLEPVILGTEIEETVLADGSTRREILISLGLFSVIELSRTITSMVRSLEYSIPHKDCCTDTDSPCEVFSRLRFPEEAFTPAALPDCECRTSCDESD